MNATIHPHAPTPPTPIQRAVADMGPGPLTEAALSRHVFPLFSRVLERREIYLANHSLGRPLDQTAGDVARALDAWYRDMDDAWSAWLAELSWFRGAVARLIGLGRADAVVPKPGAGQGLRAVLNSMATPQPRILATRGEFDSIDFILKAYAAKGRAAVTWVEPAADGMLRTSDITAAITRERPDLVVASHVFYATGQLLEGLDRIVSATHAAGARVLLDCYHSAGVVPIEFDRLGADFAIGGSYKYARGGPGAGWLAIAPRLLDAQDIPTLDTGWFAKRDMFGFQRPERPEFAAGGDAWLECTPMVLAAYQARAGLELLLAIGVDRLRAYSLTQQELLASELRARGIAIRAINPRGAFLLLPNSDAPRACARLKSAGVNADARLGHLRLCPDILNTRSELARAAEIIARALA